MKWLGNPETIPPSSLPGTHNGHVQPEGGLVADSDAGEILSVKWPGDTSEYSLKSKGGGQRPIDLPCFTETASSAG